MRKILKNANLENILAFGFFSILGIVFTYPLILKFNHAIYGFPGDSTGGIWYFWWKKYAFLNNLSPRLIDIVGAPFGLDWSNIPSLAFIEYPAFIITLITNEIFAYNFLLIMSFPISGITMYFLVKYFTKSSAAALVSGTIYTLAPYHIFHSLGHLGIAVSFQWLPLFVLSLFKVTENKSIKNMIFCGVSFSLVTLTNFYDGFFMLIFAIAFIVFRSTWGIVKNKKIIVDFNSIKSVTITVLIGIIILIPFTLNIFKTASSSPSTYAHSYDELFVYSARPWDYLLPSIYHPIVGNYLKPFISSHLHSSNVIEQTLFLGYTPLILALLAFVIWQRRKRASKKDTDKTFNFVIPFFVFAAFVALWFSAPPLVKIKGFIIPFPSHFFYKIAPMFRVYARFGNIVILCVAVLAGIGIYYQLMRIKSKKFAFSLISIVLIIVAFEFTNIPPFKVTDLSATPPVYKWLKKQPGNFIIAEYPLFPSEVAGNSNYLFFQRIHKKKLFNGSSMGSKGDILRNRLQDVMKSNNPRILRTLGVKYALVHLDNYTENKSKFTKPRNPDLKIEKRFKKSIVYKITAAPLPELLIFRNNFYEEEKWPDNKVWRWMSNNATLTIDNFREKRNVKLTFLAQSFNQPRKLKITQKKQTTKRERIFTKKRIVVDLVLKKGANDIVFTSSPGHTNIHKVLGNNDNRGVSIAFSEFKITTL